MKMKTQQGICQMWDGRSHGSLETQDDDGSTNL